MLERMDFIGFYEDWATDYYHLYDALFSSFEEKWTFRSSWRRWIFWIGALVARPRMKTRKFSATLSEPEFAFVSNITALDLKVYEYARRLKGRSLKGDLFSSYFHYAMWDLIPFIVACAIIIFLIVKFIRKPDLFLF